MSDDHIAESPTPTRCPVCSTGFTTTPGTNCPACGRVFTSQNSFTIPDLRQHPLNTNASRFQGSCMVGIGVVFLLIGTGIACNAGDALGLLIPVAILLVPAVVRTIRLATLPQAHATRSRLYYLLWSLLASSGVAGLAGIASAVAFVAACLPMALSVNGKQGDTAGMILGGIVALGVFSLIFYKLWPCESDDDKRQRSPDPEN